MNSFRKIIDKILQWVCQKSCTINKLYYVIYIFCIFFSQFVSILVTSSSIGTVKLMYFLAFFPKQINCFSNSSADSFMIKL